MHHLYTLLISLPGDIGPNPVPIKNPCSLCLKSVAINHKSLDCDSCKLWVHIKCAGISAKKYDYLKTLPSFDFTCARCYLDELPTSEIDSDLLQESVEPVPLTEKI